MQETIANLSQRTLPVLPVIQVEHGEEILPIAEAMAEGGIHALEITLRTAAGLKAIELVKREHPNVIVCAGTVTNPDQLKEVVDAGAEFVVTPGISAPLLEASKNTGVELLPGVATPSELMLGLNAGLRYFKLFPAAVVGGIGVLKSMQGPFPDVRFCPTGGLNADNFLDYLSLPNVFCVGGTWMIVKKEGVFDGSASSAAAASVSELLQSRR